MFMTGKREREERPPRTWKAITRSHESFDRWDAFSNFCFHYRRPACVCVLLTLTPTLFREWSTRTSCRPAKPFERKPGNRPRGHAAFCEHVRAEYGTSHEESHFRSSLLITLSTIEISNDLILLAYDRSIRNQLCNC